VGRLEVPGVEEKIQMPASLVLPQNLPSIARARLPEAYEAARDAIEKCARIDECKDWADKSAAMASYAKQSKDETLFNHAVKIQARAIKRCGELLAAITPKQGANQEHSGEPRPKVQTRTAAARAADLTEHEKKTALRVAAVPKETFEALVEAEKPVTVTALAAVGTKAKPKPLFDLEGKSPADFKAATAALGAVQDFAKFVLRTDPNQIARGLGGDEVRALSSGLARIADWIEGLQTALEKASETEK
jgi:hypothetical protein